MSVLLKYRLKSILLPLILTGLGTGVFINLINTSWHFANLVFGFLIGDTIFLVLYFSTDLLNKWLTKRFNLLISMILLSLYYIIVIFFVSAFFVLALNLRDINYLLNNIDRFLWNKFMFYGLLFGIGISFLLNFLFTVNNLLGKNVLMNLLLGKYHKPRTENRFFLLIDLKSSTKIAEELGSEQFLNFLNDFYYDVSIPIITCEAEIYKYVGDEIIISWKEKKARKKQNCYRCYFMFLEKIEKRKNYYQKKYGIVPGFRAALHCGKTASGELGYLKKEIAYMGDVLNTSARILEQCKVFAKEFIISETSKKTLEPPDKLFITDLGEVLLRGKTNMIRIYALERKENNGF